MATQYEVEHGIKEATPPRRRRQIDMSSFSSQLHQLSDDPSAPDAQRHNPHAVPTPVEMAGLFRLVQDQLSTLAQDAPDATNRDFLQSLFDGLESDIINPPREVAGVSQEFLDALERVPKKSLKPDDACPICAEKFLDDKYPLIVELQCHHSHRFDLECVGPWLQLKGTCPMCRTDLTKYDPRRKDTSDRIRKMWEKEGKPAEDDDEEDDDPHGLYN
ncbi:hypothetical protein KVR01_000611 [Diaporthe batatas]|uniref:uncharacterized protein n=1 Tax=Diaporthe batatas TaxID=748121 RepID=UPI001D05C162|nr:uncharacterized protein KVR01_000611 [Diaporthe batatas]KAG8169866.1 hypothetical protein KVR01_000611 [Diaporthe batatas]